MEYHPRIYKSDSVLKQSKIILGSFPTWSLSQSKSLAINREKEVTRLKNGDISYFYGSSNNQFWHWYEKYLDANIKYLDIKSIESSLEQNNIGITDVIYKCKRNGKSALDKHLTKRLYNHNFFVYPKQGEKLKILCTSKGVLNEMLLNNMFFKTHQILRYEDQKSKDFQKQILNEVNGEFNLIKKPFLKVISTNSGGIIECISIPSPGSPYRRLKDFGFDSKDSKEFLGHYLKVVFDWFIQ